MTVNMRRYSYGDKIVVNGDITVGYEHVGEYDTNICYELPIYI